MGSRPLLPVRPEPERLEPARMGPERVEPERVEPVRLELCSPMAVPAQLSPPVCRWFDCQPRKRNVRPATLLRRPQTLRQKEKSRVTAQTNLADEGPINPLPTVIGSGTMQFQYRIAHGSNPLANRLD